MARDTPEQDEDSGRWVGRITLDDVLAVFETVEGPPVITSSDVATALDCSGDSARLKLKELAAQGRVAGRETASRTLWWRTNGSDGGQTDDPEQTLKQLSRELGEPITVGDTVYEDGDAHSLSDADVITDVDEREDDE